MSVDQTEDPELIFDNGEMKLFSHARGFWLQHASGEGMSVPVELFGRWLRRMFDEEF